MFSGALSEGELLGARYVLLGTHAIATSRVASARTRVRREHLLTLFIWPANVLQVLSTGPGCPLLRTRTLIRSTRVKFICYLVFLAIDLAACFGIYIHVNTTVHFKPQLRCYFIIRRFHSLLIFVCALLTPGSLAYSLISLLRGLHITFVSQ